jgi:hypothetical protein
MFSKVVVLAYAPTSNVRGYLFTPHPCQHLLMVFLMVEILSGMRWNISVVFICISFMARDGEHFSCVFDHLDFFLRKSSG